MRISRRDFIATSLAFCGTPALAAQDDYSLTSRIRWRTLGNKDWIFNDPFERAKPGATRQPYSSWSVQPGTNRTGQLLSLIGFAEAGRLQYDAVHMSARRKPGKRPTDMTLNEVFHWIRTTPGQQHAIGRYQFIPSTLVMLKKRSNLPGQTLFHHGTQDQLAIILLRDAKYDAFLSGRITLSKFMDNLAWIWAGLPLRNGQSAYRGVAGNRATISRSFYGAQMQRIFS